MSICPKYWPMSECSGNGHCNSQGLCDCMEGWTSIGDFAAQNGVDCNIYLPTVKALYTFSLIVHILFFSLLIYFVFKKYQHNCVYGKNVVGAINDQDDGNAIDNQSLTRKQSKSRANTMSVARYDCLGIYKNGKLDRSWMVWLFLFLSNSFFTWFSALRVSDVANHVIGLDLFTTIIFCLGSGSAINTSLSYISLTSDFLTGMLKVIPFERRQLFHSRLSTIRKIWPYLRVYSYIAPTPLIIIHWAPSWTFWIAFSFYYAVAIAIMSALLFGTITAIIPMTNEIKNNISSNNATPNSMNVDQETFKSLYKKLVIVKYVGLAGTIQVGVFFILLGSWAFLSRNGSYYWPFMTSSNCFLGFNLTSLINSTGDKTSSNPESKSNHVPQLVSFNAAKSISSERQVIESAKENGEGTINEPNSMSNVKMTAVVPEDNQSRDYS